MKTQVYRFLRAGIITFISLLFVTAKAQVPTCGSNVPFYQVNLSGHPDSVWYSPSHERVGNCCGTSSPDDCTSFEVTLDTGTAMINFDIASGAIPSGAMFYQINCGPPVAVGQPFCISGPGPHHITFCKPGNNENSYMIQAIPKPIFPSPHHVRIGCSKTLAMIGMEPASVTWTSVFPGTTGQYNSYLSCTSGCISAVYTPATDAPPFVDYKICGTPIANECGYLAVCDTVRIYNEPVLEGTITPNPGAFCAGSGGITLTANAVGGLPPYTYTWKDPLNNTVSTSYTCQATMSGTYSVEIHDALYDASNCPEIILTAPVICVSPPVVSAGLDQLLCHDDATADLSGTVLNATGGIWSGGAGTFSPSNTSLNASYTATSGEITAGSVTLTLTSTGASGSCPDNSDQVVIYFAPSLSVNIPNVILDCHDDSILLSPIVLGGVGPLSYSWTDGSTSASIEVGEGVFCVTVTDSLGCNVSTCATVSAPEPLTVTSHTIDCPVPGSGVANVSVSVSGGWQSSYQVSFDNGVTYQASGDYNATLAVNATYTIMVKDSNNCMSPLAYTVHINPEVTIADVDYNKCFYGVVAATQVTVTPSGGCGGTYWISTDGGSTYQAGGSYVLTIPIGNTYTLVAKDSNGCVSVPITITLPDVLANTATVSVNNGYSTNCSGSSDGSIHVSTTGGTAPYVYTWNIPGNTPDQNGLAAGNYNVIVSDANGCQDTLYFTLTAPPPLSGAVATGNFNGYGISCNGSSDASIDLSVSGGVTAYTYQWSNGATTQDLSGLGAGTYSVIITDANNCKDTVQVTITEPPALSSTISISSNYNGYGISCFGLTDGSLSVQVSGGVATYSYTWSNGSTNPNPGSLGAGTYSVIITDANNCQDTLSATLTQPSPLTSTTSITTDFNGYSVSCAGSTNAAIDLSVAGGVISYTYQWSNGSGSEDISGIGAGTYSVLVTDANNCTTTASITVTEPPSLNSQITVTSSYNGYDISCNGLSDGSLVLQVNGGVPVYTYNWSNGSTSQNLSSLPAGTYQVIITDQNNCTDTAAVTLTQPNDLVSTLVSLSDYNGYNISCNGLTNGSIDINVTGGVTAYSYDWSNGTTSQDQNNVGAGNYTVIISDANGCMDTLNFTLTQPNVLSSVISAGTDYNGYNISCNGLSDGSINLSVSGGVTAYGYQWSNGSSSQNISGVGAGTYSVVITDANNCTDTAAITLTQPPVLTSTLTISSNYNGYDISCYGLSDGSLNLQVNGGVPVYSYNWSNGSTSQNISSLPAGTYQVIVTDQNNCTDTAAVTLTQPADLVSTLISLSDYNGYNISCNGSSNGSIDINVTGGVTAYSYNWSNGANSQDLANVGAGSYAVIVADANGCMDTLSFTLTQPDVLSSVISADADYNGYNISCNGFATGNIHLSVSGGVTAYTCQWSNGATGLNIYGVVAGTYTVLITDANGCTDTSSITLNQPDVVAVNADITHVLCNGYMNGAIDLSINGGVSPYLFHWSNGSITEDLSGIGSGTYSVTVTDDNGCTSSYTFTVDQTSPVLIGLAQTNVSCNGQQNGTVVGTVNGGTPGYTYQWSNGSNQPQINNVGPGVYVLIVTDANNCSGVSSATVSEPNVLSGTISSPVLGNGHNVSFYNSSDGTINSAFSGGTAPYTYNWSNGATSANLNGVPAGSYTLEVTDSQGCTFMTTIVLDAPLVLEMPNGISPNGDGQNDFFVIHGLEAYPNNNVTILNRWGNVVYEKDNYMNDWKGVTTAGAVLPDATYFVVLTINGGEIVLKGYVDVRH